MLDIIMEDNILVPKREYIKPISFQEAYNDIRFLKVDIINEASLGKDIIERMRKIFRALIDKVIGFFKNIISKIRKKVSDSSSYIMRNRKYIFDFSDDSIKMIIPEYLFSNKPKLDFSSLQEAIEDVSSDIKVEVNSSNKVTIPTEDELIEKLLRKTLFGFKDHERSKIVIKEHFYGKPVEKTIAAIPRNDIIEYIRRFDKDISSLEKIRDKANKDLTSALAKAEKDVNSAIDTDDIEDLTKMIGLYNSAWANLYAAIVNVTNIILGVQMSVYGDLVAVAHAMIRIGKA